ncbi:methyltransferase type 12 [Mucilaginibacter sp. PPCGB 2223]|uniref:class I SAM-dependent methyltransferase n=1 Tax=Mucilaginibacter sp. PPCGB 2223 TaxID=1886027 RepID=UPI0008264681|nr:class I SAM-dependent methyltransferase [Mucilaginibacter sp. PPCGB 2223]OCX50664.1 methyltransferase type 12 [Mucilaginibacter sp. PPCGB 2223]
MEQHLTDRAFWKAFWESKKDLIFYIKPDYHFTAIIKKLVEDNHIKTAVELGGFPGYYTVYYKKYLNLDAALFDYFIHEGLIKQLLEKNGLKYEDISVIEADLFTYQPVKKYDLVSSFGLIEHFNDLKDIIARHVALLNPKGTLFITLPNFTGINGWIQRRYDPENYAKHNIGSMNPQLLASVCKELGLVEVESYYHGRFSVWLENNAQQTGLVKSIVRSIWLAGKLFTKLVPVETKALSPYIVLKARKAD